jgi:hypothetical protein
MMLVRKRKKTRTYVLWDLTLYRWFSLPYQEFKVQTRNTSEIDIPCPQPTFKDEMPHL